MTSCAFCRTRAQYQDRHTGEYVCLEHARLEVVALGQESLVQPVKIRPATPADLSRIEELSFYFWDETVVDCFDRQYDALACPAFLACDGDLVVGLGSYALEADWDALVLVMLSVLPSYQGRGAGRALLEAVQHEAARRGLGRLMVVTTNDDLPALALYQRCGFCITEIIPDRVARDHDGTFPGFASIPVRDEIRLEYRLAPGTPTSRVGI